MRAGSFTYLHTDHLGSVVLQTDTNGNVVNDQRYFAFGRRLDKSGDISGEIDFTGQKRDATGLLYFNARYYDPQIGQFISPDTIVPDPALLIDYNRYLYARGNPIKYNDPTGHCVWDGCILEAVLAAALIGATANSAGSYIGQGIENLQQGASLQDSFNPDKINKQELVIAAGWGAFGGGAGPVTGPIGFVVANAVAGAGQKVTTDVLVDGKSLEESVLSPDTFVAAGINVIGAKVGGYLPKVPTYAASNGETIIFASGAEAIAFGGHQYASNTAEMLLSQQVESMMGPRTAASALITNSPVPVSQGCSDLIGCAKQFFNLNPPLPPPCMADPSSQR
jgi:RHS repeat-associated protein